MLICGVDEAGRGPIIGNLVMVGVMIKKENLYKFEELGVKDSKLLTQEKREDLFEQIKEIASKYKIISINSKEIDAALLSASSNLNWLEAQTSAKIVNFLKPDQVVLDCPSVNVNAYQKYFKRKLIDEVRSNAELIIEHKADLNHLVVGAASILAKVTRDRELEELKKKLGVDFGSGYLSDEKTQTFLKDNFDRKEFAAIFRKTWQPFKDLVDQKQQTTLGGF